MIKTYPSKYEKISFESMVSMVQEEGSIDFKFFVIRRTRKIDVVSKLEKNYASPFIPKDDLRVSPKFTLTVTKNLLIIDDLMRVGW